MAIGCANGITPNPDLAGIGTRINFYLTILLQFSLIPENHLSSEILDNLYESSVFYGLSLVITTAIYTLQNKLDFYHAIVVMQIIFYLDIVYAYGIRRFLRRSGKTLRIILLVAIQNFSTMVFTVWLLYVLAHDDHFGSQPDCNKSVKYVFFFISIRATSTRLRSVFVAGVVFIASSFLFKFIAIVVDKCFDLVSNEKPNRTGGELIYKFILIFRLGLAVYGAVTLELIVQRNQAIIGPGEGDWGFGQIVSLILILQDIVGIVVTLHEWRKNRKKGSPSEGLEDIVVGGPLSPSGPGGLM